MTQESLGLKVFTHTATYSAPSMQSESTPTENQKAHHIDIEAAAFGNDDTAVLPTSADSGTTADDLDSEDIHTHCKCPCGSTDFMHCIQPPPACLEQRYSNTQKFAELDLRVGSNQKKARGVMRQYLAVETESTKEIFLKYGLAVLHYAKSVAGIEYVLRQMLHLQGDTSPPANTRFEELYNRVTADVSFINPERLEIIIEECTKILGAETEEQRAAISTQKAFKETFCKFAQHRVFSYMNGLRELLPPVQEGTYPKLKIKIEENFREFLLNRTFHFKKAIRKILGIPEAVLLQVTEVKAGCVEITFKIMGVVSCELFDLSIEQKRDLASNSISMLEYAGRVHYCCCALFADEASDDIIKALCSKLNLELTTEDTITEEHFPDCPYLQGAGNCPLEECPYCGTQMPLCSLEYHIPICSLRSETSSELSKCSEDERMQQRRDELTVTSTEDLSLGAYHGSVAAPVYSECDSSLNGFAKDHHTAHPIYSGQEYMYAPNSDPSQGQGLDSIPKCTDFHSKALHTNFTCSPTQHSKTSTRVPVRNVPSQRMNPSPSTSNLASLMPRFLQERKLQLEKELRMVELELQQRKEQQQAASGWSDTKTVHSEGMRYCPQQYHYIPAEPSIFQEPPDDDMIAAYLQVIEQEKAGWSHAYTAPIVAIKPRQQYPGSHKYTY